MKHPTVVLPPLMLSDYYGERCRFLYGFVCILCDAQLFSKQFDTFPKIGNGFYSLVQCIICHVFLWWKVISRRTLAFFTAGGKLVQHSEKWSTEKFSKSDVCPKLSAYHKNARFHGNKSVKTLKNERFCADFSVKSKFIWIILLSLP